MKNKNTCATCTQNKCEIRIECPDDETTTQHRPQQLYTIQLNNDTATLTPYR